jgi:hypothetical protein
MSLEDDVRDLVERQAIVDVINDYCYYVDLKDFDTMVEKVFAVDGTDHHGERPESRLDGARDHERESGARRRAGENALDRHVMGVDQGKRGAGQPTSRRLLPLGGLRRRADQVPGGLAGRQARCDLADGERHLRRCPTALAGPRPRLGEEPRAGLIDGGRRPSDARRPARLGRPTPGPSRRDRGAWLRPSAATPSLRNDQPACRTRCEDAVELLEVARAIDPGRDAVSVERERCVSA